VLDDGTVLDVANVIWCTGCKQDLSWFDAPFTGEDGWPREQRGIVASALGCTSQGWPSGTRSARGCSSAPGATRSTSQRGGRARRTR